MHSWNKGYSEWYHKAMKNKSDFTKLPRASDSLSTVAPLETPPGERSQITIWHDLLIRIEFKSLNDKGNEITIIYGYHHS